MYSGVVDDGWQRWLTDLGNAGPDKGKGGKYLLLPPGYEGTVPDGYFVVKMSDLPQLGNGSRFRAGYWNRRQGAGVL